MTESAQIALDRHDLHDLGKLPGRIDPEVLEAQSEGCGLQVKLRLLYKFRQREKSRTRRVLEKIRTAFRKELELRKIPVQISAKVVGVVVNLRNPQYLIAAAKEGAPPNPIGQQGIEGMPEYKDQIGKPQPYSFQDAACYPGQHLKSGSMPDRGMAAVDHRCRARMNPNRIAEIFRPGTEVLHDQTIQVYAPAPEKPNHVTRPVVAQAGNLPTPVFQAEVEPSPGSLERQPHFAGRLSREPSEPPKYPPHTPTLHESQCALERAREDPPVKRSCVITVAAIISQSLLPVP